MCRSHWCKEKWSHYSHFDRKWYCQKHKSYDCLFWNGRCANLPYTINRSPVSSVAEHIRANEMLLVTVLLSLMQTYNHRQHEASKGHDLTKLAWTWYIRILQTEGEAGSIILSSFPIILLSFSATYTCVLPPCLPCLFLTFSGVSWCWFYPPIFIFSPLICLFGSLLQFPSDQLKEGSHSHMKQFYDDHHFWFVSSEQRSWSSAPGGSHKGS